MSDTGKTDSEQSIRGELMDLQNEYQNYHRNVVRALLSYLHDPCLLHETTLVNKVCFPGPVLRSRLSKVQQ